MRAAVFDEPGLTNRKVMDNIKEPDMSDADDDAIPTLEKQ
jgi:hypothetical protein